MSVSGVTPNLPPTAAGDVLLLAHRHVLYISCCCWRQIRRDTTHRHIQFRNTLLLCVETNQTDIQKSGLKIRCVGGRWLLCVCPCTSSSAERYCTLDSSQQSHRDCRRCSRWLCFTLSIDKYQATTTWSTAMFFQKSAPFKLVTWSGSIWAVRFLVDENQSIRNFDILMLLDELSSPV